MIKKYNILVTGCGGDIGQSIGKILNSDPLCNIVVGCDMSDENAGKFIFKNFIKIPPCRSEDYLLAIKNIVEEFGIDLIIPVSEPELRLLTNREIDYSNLSTSLLVANLRSRVIGFDKLETPVFLKSIGLPFPNTHLMKDVSSVNFPSIVKSRNGSGSKSQFIIKDKAELSFYKEKYPEFIVQDFIEGENGEYTCGLFKSTSSGIRTIIFRRKLMGGFTDFGTVIENKDITDVLTQIANGLDLRGSINVQLRLSNGVPMVFEINPRFSSTVLFRHLLGFKDLIWSLQDLLRIPIANYTPPQSDIRFYKGFNEYVD